MNSNHNTEQMHVAISLASAEANHYVVGADQVLNGGVMPNSEIGRLKEQNDANAMRKPTRCTAAAAKDVQSRASTSTCSRVSPSDGSIPRCGSSSDGMKNQGVSMLEQILNEKKQALMKSPEVVHFLQKHQRDVLAQRKPPPRKENVSKSQKI